MINTVNFSPSESDQSVKLRAPIFVIGHAISFLDLTVQRLDFHLLARKQKGTV